MKYHSFLSKCILGIVFMAGTALVIGAQVTIGLNRIEGRVMDETGNGVNNVHVELYDNYGRMMGRQRTTGQGRFAFRGMGPGRYTVSAKPYGTTLREDTKDIEINNQYSRSDTVVVEFRLQLDKRARPETTGVIGTVFAQEVPPEAQRLYESGIQNLAADRSRAIRDLEDAIKRFPTYFNALAALGKAQVIAGKYLEGYPFLLRAIDVNKRCSDCYYSLALAFYRLNELEAATKAINATILLQPGEGSVRLLQGMIYRLKNDLPNAEKALLTAQSLYKKPNSEVHWQLSLVYNRQKRNLEAADQLEQYLKTKADIKDSEIEDVRNLIAKLRKST